MFCKLNILAVVKNQCSLCVLLEYDALFVALSELKAYFGVASKLIFVLSIVVN